MVTKSRRRRRRRKADPLVWGAQHPSGTFAGKVERATALGAGAARATGWKRWLVIVVLAAILVAPMVIGFIASR